MRALAVVVLALASACAPSLRRANIAGLAGAELGLACDGGQTLWTRGRNYDERNMLLGISPDSTTVAGYMATAMLGTAMVWLVLPPKWRPGAWAPVGALEARAVAGNVLQDVPLCGL